MLKVEHVTVSFRGKKALNDCSIQVEKGSVFGLAGAGGSGKTTLLRTIAGLVRPKGGEVYWDTENLWKDIKRRKALIGYVPDTFGAYADLRVEEYIEFFANASGLEGLQARKTGLDLLRWAGLSDQQEAPVESLSKGMKQRLSMARAVLHKPELLLLDEPVSGYDPEGRKAFYELLEKLKEKDVTILVCSNSLSELSQYCTEVAVLRDGKQVLQGSMEEIGRQLRLNNPLEIQVRERAEEASALLWQEPSVKTIARDGQKLFLSVDGGEEEEARLLSRIVGAGIPVYSFLRRQGDLDGLFFAMLEKRERVVSSNEMESGTAERMDA